MDNRIFKEPAQTVPVLSGTLHVERTEDGKARALIFATCPDTLALSVELVAEADTPAEAAALAISYSKQEVIGIVVRQGTAVRHGEFQHGRQVILVPDALTLPELAETLLDPHAPGEDLALRHDPEPQNTLEDVWRLLTQPNTRGFLRRLHGSPIGQGYLGASNNAVYHECGETGELIIIDWSEDEGMTAHVYRGECAWLIPLDGSAPVHLHGELEEGDPLGDWHGRNV